MNNSLYNIHPVSSSVLNMQAHPGGGTETSEVPSFEGLVEDQFEKHLRMLEIAYKEPAAIRMAHLAHKLEKNSFSFYSESVDMLAHNFLTKSAEGLSDIKTQILHMVNTVRDVIDNEEEAFLDTYKLRRARFWIKEHIDGIAYEVNKDKTNWDNIILRAVNLLRDDRLYGSWSKGGEIDLESIMSNDGFKTYVSEMKKILEAGQKGREAKDLPVNEPKQPTLNREVDTRLQQRRDLAAKLAQRSQYLYDSLLEINENARSLASLRGDSAARKINLVFNNPDLHSQLRDFYKYHQALSASKTKRGITATQGRLYSEKLDIFQTRLNELTNYIYKIETGE